MLCVCCVCWWQQFVESDSVGVCLAELQSLEYGEVRAQCRLRVAQSLVVAVENASDAIEITDENHHTQVWHEAGALCLSSSVSLQLRLSTMPSKYMTSRRAGNFYNLTRNVFDCDQSNYSSRIILSNSPTLVQSRSLISCLFMPWVGYPPFRYKFSSNLMAAVLNLVWPEIRSNDPGNPSLELNIKWIGLPVRHFPNERSVGRQTYIDLIYSSLVSGGTTGSASDSRSEGRGFDCH